MLSLLQKTVAELSMKMTITTRYSIRQANINKHTLKVDKNVL